jgi:lysophospholipase L1-like esterase
VVVINQGTNEPPSPEYQGLYGQYLAQLRRAYPKAKLVALRPFGGAHGEDIKAAVSACNAAGDSRVYYIDSTGWYTGPLHPNIEGSATLAEKLVHALKTQVL